MIVSVVESLRLRITGLQAYLSDNANQILSYENRIQKLRKEDAETLEEIAAHIAAIEKLES